MTELSIRNSIVEALRGMGAYVLVTTGVATAGTPDLLVCYHGRFIGIEVKDEKGRVEPKQYHELNRIARSGGITCVARNVNDAVAALARARADSPAPDNQEGEESDD